MVFINVLMKNSDSGLRSASTSLYVISTYRLRLFNNQKNRALAQNYSLLIIPETHYYLNKNQEESAKVVFRKLFSMVF